MGIRRVFAKLFRNRFFLGAILLLAVIFCIREHLCLMRIQWQIADTIQLVSAQSLWHRQLFMPKETMRLVIDQKNRNLRLINVLHQLTEVDTPESRDAEVKEFCRYYDSYTNSLYSKLGIAQTELVAYHLFFPNMLNLQSRPKNEHLIQGDAKCASALSAPDGFSEIPHSGGASNVVASVLAYESLDSGSALPFLTQDCDKLGVNCKVIWFYVVYPESLRGNIFPLKFKSAIKPEWSLCFPTYFPNVLYYFNKSKKVSHFLHKWNPEKTFNSRTSSGVRYPAVYGTRFCTSVKEAEQELARLSEENVKIKKQLAELTNDILTFKISRRDYDELVMHGYWLHTAKLRNEQEAFGVKQQLKYLNTQSSGLHNIVNTNDALHTYQKESK